MKKIITMIIAIALVAACAISASAEDYSALRVETGDKEDGGYAAVDVLGASYDGNAKFDNNGIALEGETEAHAFQTTGSYKTGGDDYSVGAEGTVTAAGVNTGAGIGAYYDEDGNVKVGAKAGAEAVAVEAKGKVTSSAGGVEIGVTGGVKIGAGLHGECSYENGKLKVEFGAALGVGGDIGFELDFSNFKNPFANGIGGSCFGGDYTMNPMNNMIGVGGPDYTTIPDFSGEPIDMSGSGVCCAVEIPAGSAGYAGALCGVGALEGFNGVSAN